MGLSHQDHVELIDAVERLDLQADRPADLRLELGKGRRFLVEETFHDVLMGEYQQLAARELPALSHYLSKDLVAHRFGGANETATLAGGTRRTQQMFQALAGTLAGHLDEPERREAHDVGPATPMRRSPTAQPRSDPTVFTNIRNFYGALGVMLFLIALFLVLDKSTGAKNVITAVGKTGVDIFTVLQGRTPRR